MDSAAAKSFQVAAQDPPQEVQLGQAPVQRGRWWRWPLLAIVVLFLTGRFGWEVYQARHRPVYLAYLIVTYDLFAVLCCCLAKQMVLPRDDPAAAPERRRVSIAVWVVSVALAVVIAARVALVMPVMWLKIAVLVITGVGIGLSFYFFACADAATPDARRTTGLSTRCPWRTSELA